uniref:ATP-dependent RNA helicase n=1 Tax=Haemonchus contortus TaxID=6289 RepID=A0A7I4YS04_HAECO
MDYTHWHENRGYSVDREHERSVARGRCFGVPGFGCSELSGNLTTKCSGSVDSGYENSRRSFSSSSQGGSSLSKFSERESLNDRQASEDSERKEFCLICGKQDHISCENEDPKNHPNPAGSNNPSYSKLVPTNDLLDAGDPNFFEQQVSAIACKGRDVLACTTNASGRKAAFLSPVLTAIISDGHLSSNPDVVCSPRCLILVPTADRAMNIYNEGRKLVFNTMVQIAVIIPRTSVFEINNWKHGTTILVATIGRAKHFLCEGHLSLRKMNFIILDDVESMLELGFELPLNFILDHPSMVAKENRRAVMFCAKISDASRTLAGLHLKPNFLTITQGQSNIPDHCIAQEEPDFLGRDAKKNGWRVDRWNTSRH